jgi:hypothetical protein
MNSYRSPNIQSIMTFGMEARKKVSRHKEILKQINEE